MKKLEADYLVIGSGAVSMAFVDTMLDESDASFIMVDRHHMPGGHWNDAYPFVRLHQPSALYGVASTDLGSNRVDVTGSNKGYYELASGSEISAYFERVMRERFLASGRVRYFPLHECTGAGAFRSLLGGETYEVDIKKKTVDGTYFNTSVPSTHARKFEVGEGVACIAPNQLPKLASGHQSFTILGGGKTAMDAGVWLLDNGVPPERVTWVCPRASWLINRVITQPGKDFFAGTVGGFASQLEAMVEASSVDDLFLRLEAAGVMLRIDPSHMPSMFHYATISAGEVAQLARIKNTVRGERVRQIASEGMTLESGQMIAAKDDTLYIDCTASAVIFESDERTKPVFEAGKITLQAVFAPLVTYSAAIIARVEAGYTDDAKKNQLCTPVRLADTPLEWLGSFSQNMINQNTWNQDKAMRNWLNTCRLNPNAAAVKEKALDVPGHSAIVDRIRMAAIPAVMNVQKLMAQAQADG